MNETFHGSYRPEQVTFLLKPLPLLPFTDIAQKEALLQRGQHYSEMLSSETLPRADYLHLFDAACAAQQKRLAQNCLRLAAWIQEKHLRPPVLVSLARAGTPVGVILQALLSEHYGENIAHYSVSILRQRGIDFRALDFMLHHHEAKQLVFIDGWSSKGLIAAELKRSLAQYQQERGVAICPDLGVLSDLSGAAAFAASTEDDLIPHALLNATVSGLVSRSVWPQENHQDYHSCVFYQDWREHDRSQNYVAGIIQAAATEALPPPESASVKPDLQTWLAQTLAESGRSMAYIKIGIGETTRALLRRQSESLWLRDARHADVVHLLYLAAEKGIPWQEKPDLPCQAVAWIQEVQP